MDAHLRHLLRKFQAESTPENAMAFTAAYLRSAPPEPEVEFPLGLDQVIARARQREIETGEECIFPDDKGIDFDEIIKLSFDSCLPPDFTSSTWEWFYDMLNDAATSVGTIQDSSYNLVAMDPETDSLYFQITGWIQPDNWEDFDTPQNACPFCLNADLTSEQRKDKRFKVACKKCEFEWYQKIAPSKARRYFL